MEQVKISVIMPVYNSGAYLEPAIHSVLSQDFDSFELILVDDGSTDGSGQKCDEFAERDKRIKVIHQENKGICSARNTALHAANGKYVAFADHDDVYLPGLLKTVYEQAVGYNLDFVKFSKEYQIIKNGEQQRVVKDTLKNAVIRKEDYKDAIVDLITRWALDCVWDGLYSLDIIKTNSLYFDEYFKKGGEDIAFNLRYMCYSSKMGTISDTYYIHYVRSGFSTSSKYFFNGVEDQAKLTSIVFHSLESLAFDFIRYKKWYTFYLMRNYFCIVASILANPLCPVKYSEKIKILKDSLNNDFVPDDLFDIRTSSVLRYSKKVGVAYFCLKNRLYRALFLLFTVRKWLPNLNIE